MSVCVFPGNRTHNLGGANAMLYHRTARLCLKFCIYISLIPGLCFTILTFVQKSHNCKKNAESHAELISHAETSSLKLQRLTSRTIWPLSNRTQETGKQSLPLQLVANDTLQHESFHTSFLKCFKCRAANMCVS